jgi:hypothetical protein
MKSVFTRLPTPNKMSIIGQVWETSQAPMHESGCGGEKFHATIYIINFYEMFM